MDWSVLALNLLPLLVFAAMDGVGGPRYVVARAMRRSPTRSRQDSVCLGRTDDGGPAAKFLDPVGALLLDDHGSCA